ncbi:MAG: hypothetical protein ABIW79_05525 [Gemmatimonas sp.]
MPAVQFSAMPDTARVWVFGAAAPLVGGQQQRLVAIVDDYLSSWRAHGAPLVCARDWRDDRFLAVAVDEVATGASGCSIDGMFRTLANAESEIGTSLVGGGRIFWRNANGAVHTGSRSEFVKAAKVGEVSLDSHVMDLTVSTVGEWRSRFERPAADTWHAKLVGGPDGGSSA